MNVPPPWNLKGGTRPLRTVPDTDLERRLRAVERAVTDGDRPVSDLSDAAAVHDRLDDLAAELDDVHERLDALDATVQSLHGYVGDLETVNDRVERRADAARAAVERLEDGRRRAPPSREVESAVSGEESPKSTPSDADIDDGTDSSGPLLSGSEVPSGAPAESHGDPFASEADRRDVDSSTDSLLDRVRKSL